MSNLGARMELAALAHRRYPDFELPFAIMCFQSDRQRAGLGALDERTRRGCGGINNYKRVVLEHGQVRYHLVRKSPARRAYEPMQFEEIANLDTATATVQTVMIPAREEHLCVPAERRDFQDQAGRRYIAAMLRKARRQLRATPSSTQQGEGE